MENNYSEKIRLMREKDLAKNFLSVLNFIGLPVISIGTIMGFEIYSKFLSWRIFRINFFILVFFANIVLRGKKAANVARPMFFLVIGYIAYHSFILVPITGGESSLFINDINLIIIGCAVLPIRMKDFFVISICGILMFLYLISPNIYSISGLLSSKVIFTFILLYVVSNGVFIFTYKLRNEYYKQLILREEEIKTREQIIEKQSNEIAEGKVAKKISSMTQMVAHDVRKPFYLLKTVFGLLEQPSLDKSTVTLMVREVNQAMTATDILLKDIVDFGSQQKYIDAKESLVQAIDEAKKLCKNLHPQALCDYQIEDLSDYFYKGDQSRIVRVFANLFSNAVEATKPNTTNIVVSATHEDGFIKVIVKNTGSSIPPEIQKTIFEPHVSVGKRGGSGLGLAITKTIVENHGGRIYCESDNNSVSFVFFLPTYIT